ncbi:MAG: N-6 DNA methylase [Alphaproteobacteria bacterium GM202ARS2]|nr:N-6 DNA methylase [Alphaproteobacteria bacterium GM202ARS2]
MALVSDFISKVEAVYKTKAATENSYRSALEMLFKGLEKGVTALNEPKRVKCGAPDFIIQRRDVVIGHVEAKGIGFNLRDMKGYNKGQQERYLKGFPNLIYTNCLDWDFYRKGDLIASVSIATLDQGSLSRKPKEYKILEKWLNNFIAQKFPTITSPMDLAKNMAGKANIIKSTLYGILTEDQETQTQLSGQYEALKKNLIHDIDFDDFADIYAETIVYGMFAARLHDTTGGTFSRRKALELLPNSNPFLRSLFSYVAGYELDDRITWIIDDLAYMFQACDVAKLMRGFGSLTGRNDPFLHFYETFLSAYNPDKRKARGVWYTPESVVKFIVRAVDDVLKNEFGLPDGLADTSKVDIDWEMTDDKGRVKKTKNNVHRVQILDPATGTGTFLAEVIKQIAPKVKSIAPSMWSQYIEEELIPRLHGFEIHMAAHAMCHIKLHMILTDLGYESTVKSTRLSVFLTNSLEEGKADNEKLPFMQWLSLEAQGANIIKRNMPIMCVIGNPPYSSISQNMGKWITELIEDYKYVDGEHFQERKHWLHDDYVKFIRLSESLIEKNGEGVLGFITNHGYLDNSTFRGMRWHLLQTFDKIYILDLHGNSNKREVTPEGKPDKNVFDIKQGVAIIIALKKNAKKKKPAEVYHRELWGERDVKYKALMSGQVGKLFTEKIDCSFPDYTFVKRDNQVAAIYREGFDLTEFMSENVTAIVTMGDNFAFADSSEQLRANLDDLLNNEHTESSLKDKYSLGKHYPKWLLSNKDKLKNAKLDSIPVTYRPFDDKVMYFSDLIIWRLRKKVTQNLLLDKNTALVFSRQSLRPVNVLVTPYIFDGGIISSNQGIAQMAPLYIYPDEQDLDQTRRINFDTRLYSKLQKLAKHRIHGTPDEMAVFDYIYGVLHCPAYRNTYADFLKKDFPRIPWPFTPDEFWDVSAKGSQLHRLHLMDSATIGETDYPLNVEGNNVVDKPCFKDGQVYINSAQYFGNVPKVSWDFYICGYQPAQKWLKDRKGLKLNFEDVKHYQRILKVLSETDRIMATISMTLRSSREE